MNQESPGFSRGSVNTIRHGTTQVHVTRDSRYPARTVLAIESAFGETTRVLLDRGKVAQLIAALAAELDATPVEQPVAAVAVPNVVADVVAELDAIRTDPELAELQADELLLTVVPAEVADAYRRALRRNAQHVQPEPAGGVA
jgi:hypothetical protein